MILSSSLRQWSCLLSALLLSAGCKVKMAPAEPAPPPEEGRAQSSGGDEGGPVTTRDHRTAEPEPPPEPKTYEDAQGNEVELQSGGRAFVDRVVSFDEGDPPTHDEGARDAEMIIGPPNYERDEDGSYVTLGCRGTITLEFVDNALVEAGGADLYVFEIGGRVGSMSVEISPDGETWLDAGDVKGQPAQIDIAEIAEPGVRYRFVRITDTGSSCGKRESPGADIDAVGVIGAAG